MRSLSTLHKFLQRIRLGHSCAFDPDSTFVYRVHKYGEPARNFDWLGATVIGRPGKERFVPAIAIRHNGVGVISLFGDGGLQKEFQRAIFDDFAEVQLHPIQFCEIASRLFYGHSLFADQIGYSFVYATNGPFVATPHFPPEGKCWNDWEDEEYAMHFFRQLKERSTPGIISLSDVYCGNNSVITFLYQPDGTKRVATANELS